MTIEEAKKVAAICSTADSGCPFCVHELMEKLAVKFPEFEWQMNDERVVVISE